MLKAPRGMLAKRAEEGLLDLLGPQANPAYLVSTASKGSKARRVLKEKQEQMGGQETRARKAHQATLVLPGHMANKDLMENRVWFSRLDRLARLVQMAPMANQANQARMGPMVKMARMGQRESKDTKV